MVQQKGIRKSAQKVNSSKASDRTNKNKNDYDVIVIGTGMGGSAAGAICALHGLKTLILEKNPRVGGACSYYDKQGFKIDIGTHLFIRGNKGPFGECTNRLGMGMPIDFLHTDPVTEFRGLNYDLVIPGSGKMAMLGMYLKFIKQLHLPIKEFINLKKMMDGFMSIKDKELDALDKISIDEFIRRYSTNGYFLSLFGFLMDLYFILPATEISAGEAIWNLQKMLKNLNLCYPRGGAVAIPETFLKGAEQNGAVIKLNAGVKKIEVAGGRVKGVVLQNGQRFTAKAVISTTSVKDTVLKLTGQQYFPKGYIEKINKIKSSMIAVQAKIALKKKLTNAGSLVGGVKLPAERFSGDVLQNTFKGIYSGTVPEFIPIYAPVPSNYDPDLVPAGCQLITTCGLSPTLDIKLKDAPQLWMEKMMNSMRSMLPNLDDNIIFCDYSSVQNIADWIGKSNGAAVTTAQTTDQVGRNRPPHETPVRGLYIAGDGAGQIRGIGTELACKSGMNCADLIIRDLKFSLI